MYNGDAAAVNLQGWTLADLDSDRTSIAAEVWLQPGEYAVLGRSADGTANGGLAVRSVYTGLQLANEGDELILLAPWGEEVDRVAWGDGTELGVSQGASLERNGFAPGAAWVTAAQSWPGSWGDLGSPNLPYVPRAPALPTVSPTLAPTPLSLPSAWEPAAEPAALAIDEVYYLSADDEYIVLANVGDADADLSGWSIGDAEAPGNAEGVVALPDGRRLAPGQLFVIARNAQAFRARWGRSPDAEIEESDAQIPTLSKRAGWASGVLALNDSGDEVILLDPTFHVADAVAYGEGAPAALHLVGALRVAGGQSLQRVPGFRYPAVAEQRHRFLAAMPQPFDARALPAPQARDRPALGDGLTALWGTLGASSNFSTGGTAPPHFVAAAAAAEGLHFLALADPAPAHGDEVLAAAQGALINLPAWQWRNADGAQAVIYGASSAELATWADLGSFLAANHYVAQAQVAEPPALPGLAAVEADAAGAPGALTPLMRSWRAVGRGLLPAGNALPPIDGFTPAARYTGLAVARTGAEGVLEALTAQRGWLTSAPGIVLSLRVRAGPWMGSAIEPADEATLEIVFADSTGEPAGLALWQDGQPVRTLDVPPSDGRWEVSLPATPGSFLYAVATELDGDFAVTAPLWVTYAGVEPAPVAELSPPPPAQRAVEKLSQADNPAAEAVALKVEQGEAAGAPGSLTTCKLQGLGVPVEFRAQVLAPPELFNSAIYVAEPAEAAPGVAGLGVQVYLRGGVFMPLQEGDWVLVRGQLASFRGELEVSVDQPDQVWRYAAGAPLLPLRVTPGEVGESLEGRLVTFEGVVSGWQGDSIYLCDPAAPDAPVRVTVRSSLDWKRPYVNKGERWLVTGIVSQFAKEHPWNGGYRVLVRYPTDLVRVDGR